MNHRSRISRGDLLRCISQCPGAEETAARLCGFMAAQEPVQQERPGTGVGERPAVPRGSVAEPAAIRPAPGDFDNLTLWVPWRYQSREEEPAPEPEDVEWLAEEAFDDEEVRSASDAPDPAPLVPWSRLWPFLHQTLGCLRPGHRLDSRRLIWQLARLQPVRRIPRIPRLTWSPQARVLVDRRAPLALFRTEFEQLIRRLRRQRGRSGLHCVAVDRPPDLWPGDAPVLVLSDLGCLDQNAIVRDDWREFAARRKWRRTRPTALMPCPKLRWDAELCRLWYCHVWDRGHRLRHPPQSPAAHAPEVTDDHAERVERLLSLLSPTIRIEPALLRGARLLLPSHRADVGTEFDAWFHQDAQRTPEAMALRTPAALRRRDAFAEFDTATKRSMIELIRFVHRRWSPSFFARETVNLHESGAPVPHKDMELAWKTLRRFNKTMFQMLVDDPARARKLRLFEWQQSDYARSSPAARAAAETAVAWELGRAWRREQVAVVPDDIDHEVVKETQKLLLVEHAKLAVWQVARVGSGLAVTSFTDRLAVGSPAGLIPAISPRFDLLTIQEEEDQRSVVNLLPRPRNLPKHAPVTDARHVVVRSDRGQLDLRLIRPPAWVSRFGWDRFGLFADFEVDGVTFALRWVPPGEFEMGSPEEEPGRFGDEGPRHRVTIGQGFWMASTPVTQAQYAVVTSQRPSRFKNAGDQAPVEQVSWDECRAFCDKLQKKLVKLDKQAEHELTARLPSEAQWECACRAGTDAALYTGPLTIVGERNGPELDAIAWYGGNSGVDYEGAEDSSKWPEKQYEHRRAGTHPVGTKQPNAWGLYDMLGNVWEWCEDAWHDNYEGAPDDGTVWADDAAEGGYRVVRGGSWAYQARNCRCASRSRWPPDFRFDYRGFRFVFAARFNEGIRRFP